MLFPAQAGVILRYRARWRHTTSVPAQAGVILIIAFYDVCVSLFPAQAGVILRVPRDKAPLWAVPRASGGDPRVCVRRFSISFCSPRKRG